MDDDLRQEAVEKLDRSIQLAEKANQAIEDGAPLDGPEVEEFRAAVREVNLVLREVEADLIHTPATRALDESEKRFVERVHGSKARAPRMGQEPVALRFFKSALFPLVVIVILVYVLSQLLGTSS